MNSGTQIGPYEVLGKLGAGGMGEVYKARDAKLQRDVAIKLLPELFARDPDRLARFEREARTLAALNHPNIAQIYGVLEDPPALVMEFVPGRTLEELRASKFEVGSSKLDVPEAIVIARAIAEGLEAAHDAGIIHRDLKPANVKVRDDGVVKVLDFGLAKSAGLDSASGDLATLTSPAITQQGLILGTAAYMAPEQARGKTVDKRADVWAFGVVLYELLSGRRLFDGETVSDVIAAVLTRPIDMGALPDETPARVRELVARCLERDPKRRLRDIGEARIVLEGSQPLGSSGSQALESERRPRPERSRRLPWVLAAASTMAAAILAFLLFSAGTSSRPLLSSRPSELLLEIGPPPEGDFVIASNAGGVVISPDGSSVAFIVQTSAGRKLYVRSLATGEMHALPGTSEVTYPFWSADSRRIAFFGNSKLFTMSVAGGLPEAVADIQQGRGGAWTDSGVILFTPVGGGSVHRVSDRGGPVEKVTTLDGSRGENAHYWPVALPGGRKFLFFIRSTRPENNGIYLGSVDGAAKPVRVITSLSSGLYAPVAEGGAGRLLWVRDGNLLAQAFDTESGTLTGEVVTVATDVRVDESQRGTFADVSANGTVVWASARAADHQLAWYDRNGRRGNTLPIAAGKLVQPRLSSDGKRLLVTRAAGGTADVWLHDIASGATTQLTTDPGYDENAVWADDGRTVLYQSGAGNLTIVSVDGSRPTLSLLNSSGNATGAFSRDGQSLFVVRDAPAGGKNLATVHIAQPDRLTDLTSDPESEIDPTPSPDGRWLAFVSDRSARPEVVVAELVAAGQTFTLGSRRFQISAAGGVDPHWRNDGREIVYVAPDGTLTAASLTITGNNIALGPRTPLFRLEYDAGGWNSSWHTDSTHTQFVVVEAQLAKGQRLKVRTGWK